MKRLVLVLALASIPFEARAITYDRWVELSESLRNTYISGMGEGFGWANAYIDPPAPSLYCPPDALGLTGTQYVEILRDYADRYRSSGSFGQEVGLLLIEALKEAFPCR